MKPKIRDRNAVAARRRKAGPHADRRTHRVRSRGDAQRQAVEENSIDVLATDRTGWPIRRGYWVRVEWPSSLVPGHTIRMAGTVEKVIVSKHGTEAVVLRDSSGARVAPTQFCRVTRRRPPRLRFCE